MSNTAGTQSMVPLSDTAPEIVTKDNQKLLLASKIAAFR